ncbi:MAG: SRPBCC domain-containing protein [Proteobacteria bacterium]|nr:SRPBCC domain-containing protein [Pseudomonadota bacterium]
MSIHDESTLEIRRTFDAPPERVFDAWLEREEWQAWIGPEGVDCEVPLLEPRVGGRYRIDMRLADGRRVPVAGTFTRIERPHVLAFTWGWDGDPARQSQITLTFTAHGGQTEFLLRQEGLGTIASRDDHGRGWASALGKLDRYLVARGAPGAVSVGQAQAAHL